jgi:DNA repair exonuclease SbcCD ATPase subunit
MSEVSTRSTKQELMSAYEKAKAEIERLKANKISTNDAAKREKDGAVLRAEKLSLQDVGQWLNTIRQGAVESLDDLRRQIELAHEELQSIKTAVGVKQGELKEIYGIEHEASTLAALIEAHHQKEEDLRVATALVREGLQKENAKLEAEHEENMAKLKAEIETMDQDAQERRERQEKDWAYNFQITQRDRIDVLNQDLKKREREWADRMEFREKAFREQVDAVQVREKKCAEIEKTNATLQAQLDGSKADKEKAIIAAVEANTIKMTEEMENKLNNQRVTLQSDKAILAERLNGRDEQLMQASNRIAQLEAALALAHKQINEVAVKTLDTSHAKEAMAKMEKLATDAAAVAGKRNGN